MEKALEHDDFVLEAYRQAAARLEEITRFIKDSDSQVEQQWAHEQAENILAELDRKYGDPDFMP